MALKDVIIGYAKGDKGDKGDIGERGATGQTGPQGEPGNIADAAITDTQGLDVAKGAKTTAQKLFDAIADRIVNKLVTNDTLTTKLADYLLKSAMSSTNINSTTNVPTSALVYSLLQDVNNNLSKAISCSDLFADYLAPTFVEWNGNTLNTPFKAGFTDCQEGFAFCYGNRNNYMTVIAFAKNSNKMWAWSKAVNAWIEYVTKSDLFGELCTNPNTFTALIAMVNGYDSNISNVPDAAKKKFSVIQNVWASPNDMGDLTKTHMQVLIIGNGGGVVTRKYESNAWSSWQ